jgi:hypothetical protein
MEINVEVPHKTKNRTTNDPAIPLLGTYPKESKSANNRDTSIPMLSQHYP